MTSPQPLRTIDADMVHGLPEPTSPEALDWIRDALANLQRQEPGADGVGMAWLEQVMAEIRARLDALESRPLPVVVDLSGILSRLEALEALVALPPPPPAVVNVTVDPLDPAGWAALEDARAALMVIITKEAARRVGHSVELYEEMVHLDGLGERRTPDQDLLLLQHQSWAKERQFVELARLTHLARIRALESVEDARAYEWRTGWPEVAGVAVHSPAAPAAD